MQYVQTFALSLTLEWLSNEGIRATQRTTRHFRVVLGITDITINICQLCTSGKQCVGSTTYTKYEYV